MDNGKLPSFLYNKDTYRTAKQYVVLDLETTTLQFGSAINPDNHIVLACWRIVDREAKTIVDKYKFADEYDQQELADDIANSDFVVAQNAKFEMQWLKRMGVDLRKVLPCCTMLMAWVLDGNVTKPRNLSALGARYGLGSKMDVISKLIKGGKDWQMSPTEIPDSWLLEYCERDVDLTHKVFLKQLTEICSRGQQHILHVRNLTCAVLADIEFTGMELDKTAVYDEYDKVTRRLDELTKELQELTGGINLSSPKQLGTFLYDVLRFKHPKNAKGDTIKTPKGEVSTSTIALAALVPETDGQKEFVSKYKEYNRLDSLLTKNLEFFKGVCDEHDGKFYGSINQGVTATHRLASTGRPLLFKAHKRPKSAQFQNLPRDYKRLFAPASDDYVYGEFDGSALEFRVAADLGKDPVANEEIETGVDVHSNTARELFNAGDEELLSLDPSEHRQASKKSTFAPLFGGLGKSVAQRAYAEYFKEHYKGISDTQRGWALTVLDKKYLRTDLGMMFFWPDTSMSRSGYITNTTSIFNYPIQSSATAEIIPIALIFFWYRSAGTGIEIANSIHDSVLALVPKEGVNLFMDLAKQSMTMDVYDYLAKVYGYNFTTSLGVGIKVSKHWGHTKEETTYSVKPDGTFTVKIKN